MLPIFGKALPQEEYETKNQAVTSIPDMNSSEKDYSECLMLFRAGVLTGKDDQGNFYPAQNITRAEVAAMLNRIIDKTQRKAFTPAQGQTPDDPTPTTPPAKTPMNAEQIAAAAESSVFTVLCYDKDGKLFGSGSGFFIDADGTAVTNFHVIQDTYSAEAQLNDEKTYKISKVIGYDPIKDIAIIKVDGANFKPLALADSSKVRNGQKIYCVGSPMGLSNSISEGIVANASRDGGNGVNFIQITAPISPGSSGGAVLNEYCEVIGISTGTLRDSQSVNLAVPSNEINSVSRNQNITVAQLYEKLIAEMPSVDGKADPDYTPPKNVSTYAENSAVPDYGSVTGAKSEEQFTSDDGTQTGYWYPYSKEQFESYCNYLLSDGWTMLEVEKESNLLIYPFRKGTDMVFLAITTTPSQSGVSISLYVKDEKDTASDVTFYPGTNIPDYGSITDRKPLAKQSKDGIAAYAYSWSKSDVDAYIDVLEEHGFTLYQTDEDIAEKSTTLYYTKGPSMVAVFVSQKYSQVVIMVPEA